MDPARLAPRVRDRLRRCGVVVHLVAPGRSGLVVFLEGALGQNDKARTLVLAFCGVAEVRFSRASKAVMFVDLAPVAPTATESVQRWPDWSLSTARRRPNAARRVRSAGSGPFR
ncbi:hypothetical protein Kisp01_62630 [Kineosporia sp. NBRC 101677]|nr:hypothetical protein Kisp01_62630 [Kineosporia sp. NBRC 101677]